MTASTEGVLDPELFPSLLPCVQAICALLVEAGQDAHSLQQDSSGTGAIGTTSKAGIGANGVETSGQMQQDAPLGDSLPSFVLGAMSEEELVTDYGATSTRSGLVGMRPTELQMRIVREAQLLRDTLKRIDSAIQDMPGGQLSLQGQEDRIKMLEAQLRRQASLEKQFIASASFAEKAGPANSTELMDTS